MKRIFSLLIIAILIVPGLKSQTVDSIKVEQLGELIKINYKILNSTPGQIFRVTVLCSINGGLQSVLKSLSGDVGDNIMGGRPDYMVIWDVLKDVDEIKSVDFSVRAELLSGKPTLPNTSEGKLVSLRRFHTQFILDSKAAFFGLRIGFMGAVGVSTKYISGTWIGEPELGPVETLHIPFTLYTTDFTVRLIKKDKFQMHLMAGFAMGGRNGDKYNDRFNNYSGKLSGVDWGILMDIRRLSVSLEMTELLNYYSAPDFVVLGIGMRF